jgi:hypothetical protein
MCSVKKSHLAPCDVCEALDKGVKAHFVPCHTCKDLTKEVKAHLERNAEAASPANPNECKRRDKTLLEWNAVAALCTTQSNGVCYLSRTCGRCQAYADILPSSCLE